MPEPVIPSLNILRPFPDNARLLFISIIPFIAASPLPPDVPALFVTLNMGMFAEFALGKNMTEFKLKLFVEFHSKTEPSFQMLLLLVAKPL